MRIGFKSIYGNQENLDIQICKPILTLDSISEELEALKTGWSIYNNIWFQSRMTRIKLSEYNKQPKPIKGHEVEYSDNFIFTTEIETLYENFTKFKGFTEKYKIDTDLERSSSVIIKKNKYIVALTKFVKYEGDIESQYTILDYKEPKLSLGRKIVDYEVFFAKQQGYDYLYIGSGYGEGGIYKSNFPGFEWWTGEEWSCDIEEYVKLCLQDATITNFIELNKAFNC